MDNAKALGQGASFTFENVTYNIPPTVLSIQAEFERRFVALAYENLRAVRSTLKGEYEAERNALRRDVDAGLYNFESDLVKNALSNVKHQKLFTFVSLAYANKDKDITPALIDKIFESDKAMDFIDAFQLANSSPNENPPQTNT